MPIEIQELTIRAVVESAARVVEVDSTKLEDDVDGQLASATVIDRLQMPDTFTLVFRDPERDILERAKLDDRQAGQDLDRRPDRGDRPDVLIDGEVTSIEVEYDTTGSRAIVRGYDLSHRLTAGRKSKTRSRARRTRTSPRRSRGSGRTCRPTSSRRARSTTTSSRPTSQTSTS